MISVNNYENIRTSLTWQLNDRGIKHSYTREEWDTFPGWKKRGKTIMKGSKGFDAEIVYPYLKKRNGGKIVNGFFYKRTKLFSIDQVL